MKIQILYLWILVCFPLSIFSQKIDNTASFRSLKGESYFRMHYDNDYFAATDKNYTQGYNIELVSPFLNYNPINKLLVKGKDQNYQHGLAIEHIGYTPKNIGSDEIQFGDRPFAAAIMLKSFRIATNYSNKTQITSALSLGIIGPGAFGKEMQVGIHEATGNTIPQGWQYQIKNDLVLNYEVGFEKQIFDYNNVFTLQANSKVRAGTLFTNASVGFNAVAGLFNNHFLENNSKSFQLYVYSQPLINAVGYDATLQGGIFNTKSPYTIASGDIERVTAQFNYGVVFRIKGFYAEYSRTTLTREFESGNSAQWGGIRLGFNF